MSKTKVENRVSRKPKRLLAAWDTIRHMHRCFPREWGIMRRRRALQVTLFNSNSFHNRSTGFLEWKKDPPRWVRLFCDPYDDSL